MEKGIPEGSQFIKVKSPWEANRTMFIFFCGIFVIIRAKQSVFKIIKVKLRTCLLLRDWLITAVTADKNAMIIK